MTEDEEEYRPRKDDHRVEPMYSGLGLGDDQARESAGARHEVEPDSEQPGLLLRWIRSAREIMRGERSVKRTASRPKRGR